MIKQIWIAGFIFLTSLMGQDLLNQSQQLLGRYNADLYNLGIQKYRNGEYRQAYDLYRNMLRSNPNSTRINFMLGISAFALKEYEQALNAFNRVLTLNPNHQRSRLERARTLYRLGRVDEAGQEFSDLKTQKLPPQVKKKVNAYLDAIRSKGKKHYFDGSIMLGVLFDDNVENTTTTESFILPVNNLELSRTSDLEEDMSHIELATISHIYDFGEKGGYAWKSDLTGYMQSWGDHDNRDVDYAALGTGPIYKGGTYQYGVPLSAEKLWYGSQDYLNVIGINPNISMKAGKKARVALNSKIQKKSYAQTSDSDKDAMYYDLGIKAGIKVSEDSLLELSYNIMMERKEDGSNPYVDYDAYKVKAKYIYALTRNFKVDVNGAYKQTEYLDEDPNFLLERSDTQTNIGAGVNARLTQAWLLNGAYNYINNDSNRVVNDYSKSTMFFNVMYDF